MSRTFYLSLAINVGSGLHGRIEKAYKLIFMIYKIKL